MLADRNAWPSAIRFSHDIRFKFLVFGATSMPHELEQACRFLC